jgi:hypothetical protein
MSNFQPATAKIKIASLDDGTSIEAQYNPKQLQMTKTVPWQKVNQANQANGQGIHLEFTGAEGREVTVELLFDGFEQQNSIAGQVQQLETLSSVRDPTSTAEDMRRPHRCVATWGGTLPSFRCVIESLSTTYTMFGDDGTPLRATCTVTLKEADVISMGSDSGGGGGGGSGGSGSSSGSTDSNDNSDSNANDD